MKASLIVFLVTVCLSSFALACSGPDDFTGAQEAEVASRGTLTCLIGSKIQKAKLTIQKIFKNCANSPVSGTLEFYDRKIDITDVQRMSEISFIIETKQSRRALHCELSEKD